MSDHIPNCPVCKSFALAPRELESSLTAQACPNCSGQWVTGKSYWAWHDVHGDNLPERSPSSDEPELHDSIALKLCPDCGHILTRYRVGHDVEFCIDHCATCFGIWFDAAEWEILRARNLHDDIHYIFAESYQAGIFKAERIEARRRLWIEKLGEADFAEIVRIKQWIGSHPKRSELLAYLMNEQ